MANQEEIYYGGVLPEVEVTPTRLELITQYPFINEETPFTGHSEIKVWQQKKTKSGKLTPYALVGRIDKSGLDADYNLFTNNCSDATREALEEISGKKLNPFLFTTPGDSRDFFKENFQVFPSENKQGEDNYYTYISEADADIVKKYAQKQQDINIEAKRQKLREKRIKEGKATPSDLRYSDGGNLQSLRQYNDLSLRERAAIIHTAVKNGYRSLPDIVDAYNRFAEGGHLFEEGGNTDWDKTFTGKLINYAENPDSIGYSNGLWYAPVNPIDPKTKKEIKKYDTNQFGMGVDRNQTEGFSDKVKKDKKGRQYLTEKDERTLRYNAITKANNSANARYKYAQKVMKQPDGKVSKKKDAATVSAIYNLGPGFVANTIFEDKNVMNLLFNGTDEEYINEIHKYYKQKGRNERIKREREILGLK